VSRDHASVRIVDVFDAPRDVVFAAWTDPERLKKWWGPGSFEAVFAEVDLRPGGRYELLLEPGSMRLVGEFREDGERTEVVLVHDNFVGPGPVDMYDEGWRSGLDKLRAFLRPEETTDAQRQ